MLTNDGINNLLNTIFHQHDRTRWHIGLIGSGTVAESDTLLSKNWIENTSYSQTSLPRMRLGEPVTFQMTDFSEVAGIYVSSNPTKQTSDGLLFAVILFDNPITPGKSRNLTLSYTCQL